MQATETPTTRTVMIRRLIEVARDDPRIVGLVDYGSSSEGRADEWSDIDVALFLRDADFEAFQQAWIRWAAPLGPLLLAYVGGVGHPWTVYDAEPAPLRVDFDLYRESEIEIMLTWPNSPASVEAMIWYDGTGGRLTDYAGQMVGQSLGPPDIAQAFEQVCGDFWYYLLRTYSKLQRGRHWAARESFNHTVLGNLVALLRLETGMVDRWRAASAAENIERDLAPIRLAQLDQCIPPADMAGLRHALSHAAELGHTVCQAIENQRGWPWPHQLAECILLLLKNHQIG